MLLERLEMENFKCFYGRHDVVFGPRLNCITGPNGSGKSNILEAICFAFGESSCARLRVSSMKELHSKPRGASNAQDTTTRVTLHLRTRQNDPLTLSASLCARTGHRTYKLNNRITPIKHVKRHLRLQCGINVDVSLWMIQQNVVHKMPSRTPAELAAYLCEAGGTKLFFEYREEAQVAIEGFKLSVQTIQKNIRHLSDVVRRDSAVLELYRAQRDNDREIQSLSSFCEGVKQKILCAKLADVSSKIIELETSEMEVTTNLSATRAEIFRCEQEVDALRTRVNDAKPAQGEFDSLQLEVIRVTAQHEETSSRISRLLQQKHQGRLKLDHVEEELRRIIATKSSKETKLDEASARVSSMEALRQIFVQSVEKKRTRAQLDEELSRRMEEVEHEDILHTAGLLNGKLASTERCQIASRTKRDNLERLQNELSANIRSVEKEARQLQSECSDWSEDRVGRELKALKCDLDRSQAELRTLQAQLPKLHVALQGEGDFGLMMDLFRVRDLEEQGLSQWIGPLGLILQKSLQTRICANVDIAKRILAVNRNQHSFSIWPVEALKIQPRKLDRCVAAIYKEHGRSNVIDPLELVSVVDHIHAEVREAALKCLRKAVGSWLLVRTDEIGQSILKKFGLSSVSLNLNMHSPGMLSGGFNGENKVFDAFIRLPTARARCVRVEEELIKVQGIQRKLRALSAIEEQRAHMIRQRRENEEELECVRSDLIKHERQHDTTVQEQHALRNSSLRKHVLKRDLETYKRAICDRRATQLLDPRVVVFAGQSLEELQQQVDEATLEHAEIEVLAATLQSELDQLTHELKENEACLATLQTQDTVLCGQLKVLSCEGEALAAKLKQLADDQASLASTEDEIRVLTAKAKSLEAEADGVTSQKLHLQRQLEGLEQAVTSARSRSESTQEDEEEPCGSIEQLEEERARVEKQLSACIVKKKVILQELSSAPHVAEEAVVFKQGRLARFETQVQNLQTAIVHLEEGIHSTQQRSVQANKVAFAHVRRCLREIFAQVVPSKRVDLVGEETNIEAGVTFDVTSSENLTSSKDGKAATKELSGGQLAMLGLAYVFALARYSASPLYVLDEVDAALDEHNQRIVADLVLEHFNHSQVICISHHEVFHARAAQLIQVQKHEATSSVTTRTLRH